MNTEQFKGETIRFKWVICFKAKTGFRAVREFDSKSEALEYCREAGIVRQSSVIMVEGYVMDSTGKKSKSYWAKNKDEVLNMIKNGEF